MHRDIYTRPYANSPDDLLTDFWVCEFFVASMVLEIVACAAIQSFVVVSCLLWLLLLV